MALAGYYGKIIIDGTTVGEAFSWTMDDEAESLDATAFNSAGRTQSIQGLKQATGDIEVHWNMVDAGQLALYNAFNNGSLVTLQLYINETSNYYYQLTARIFSIGNETPVDDIINQTFSFEGQSAVTLNTTAPNALTVTTSPLDAATGVVVGANMVMTFSEALQTATINSDNIFLVEASTGTAIAGALTPSIGNTVVTLDPTSNLSAATAYILIITTAVKSADGSALASKTIVNFTTA